MKHANYYLPAGVYLEGEKFFTAIVEMRKICYTGTMHGQENEK
jgi:hypothetical protein